MCVARVPRRRVSRGSRPGRGGIAKSDDAAKTFVPLDVAEYPNNLSLRDLAYFVAVPTLCYETRFPRCVPSCLRDQGGRPRWARAQGRF